MRRGGPAAAAQMKLGKSQRRANDHAKIKVKTTLPERCRWATESQGRSQRSWSSSCVIRANFQRLGGHIPRGVLTGRQPGTGKTCWPRRSPAEAKVAVLHYFRFRLRRDVRAVSVQPVWRDMFEQAKKHAPCIYLYRRDRRRGPSRGSRNGWWSDEREQDTEPVCWWRMDGFEPNDGIIRLFAADQPSLIAGAAALLAPPVRFGPSVVVRSARSIRGRRSRILKCTCARCAG